MSNLAIDNLFKKELDEYRLAKIKGLHETCFKHLARAHIISQTSVWKHFYVHVLMLDYSFRGKDYQEILGQLLRITVTGPGHLFGKVPKGNIGWATVGLTEEMPIPEDLKPYLKEQL